MILKKLFGEILTEFGFISDQQLEDALIRQRKLFDEKSFRLREAQDMLVSEARLATHTHAMPMLGKILLDMGLVTNDQIEAALKEQEAFIDVYKSLEKEKLGLALEIISGMNSTLDLAEILSTLMRHVNRVTDSVAGTLMLMDEQTEELVFSLPTGPDSDKLKDLRLPKGEGIAGWVAEAEKFLLIPNVKDDPRYNPEVDKISGLETTSILCVPMKTKSKLMGVLEVVNKVSGAAFTKEDAFLLNIVASNAAMAIENARLYAELRERLTE